MKSTFKLLLIGLLTLGAVSCTQPDSTETEVELYGTDGGQSSPKDSKD